MEAGGRVCRYIIDYKTSKFSPSQVVYIDIISFYWNFLSQNKKY